MEELHALQRTAQGVRDGVHDGGGRVRESDLEAAALLVVAARRHLDALMEPESRRVRPCDHFAHPEERAERRGKRREGRRVTGCRVGGEDQEG